MATLVLVNPPVGARRRFGDIALAPAGSYVPPLGLCAVAATARAAGHTVALVDAEARRLTVPACVREVLQLRPDVVGLTATAVSVSTAAELAAGVRAAAAGARLLLGGVHLTALPEETMNRFPAFDAGVIGEGEATTLDLLARLESGAAGDWTGTPGTIVRRPDGGLSIGPDRPRIGDLDSLPLPAFDLLPGFPHLYRPQAQSVADLPSASVTTSRGCVGRCTFCDRSVFGNRVRTHGAEYVVELVRHLHLHWGVRNIQFEDDNFMLRRRRLLEVCRLLEAAGRPVTWSCLARPDCADAALFTAMRRAGCWCVMFGVESGSQAILDRLQKGVQVDQVRRAVRLARRAGLQAKGFFILGAPGETEATLAETERFALGTGLTDISLHMFTPFPGSEDYAAATTAGEFDDDWDKMNFFVPVFVPRGLTREGLERAARRIYRRFYLRPSIWWTYLKRIHGWRQFRELAGAALGLGRYVLAAGARGRRDGEVGI